MSRFWLVGFDRTYRKVNGRLQIYGVGTTGLQMAEALAVSGQFELLVFVVDDMGKVGRSINCVHVFPREVIPVWSVNSVLPTFRWPCYPFAQ